MNECAMRLATVMRTASPADSPSICRLYAEAYRPPEGGDPRTCYPFPQFLDPDCVARLVTSEAIRWFVAEAAGRIIGTVGAVVNIGTAADRVAECFGLVVDQQFRFHCIGSELFSLLCRSLAEAGEGDFMMAEARTAPPEDGRWSDGVPPGYRRRYRLAPSGSLGSLRPPLSEAVFRRPLQHARLPVPGPSGTPSTCVFGYSI